ncbi:tagaturonate reductase [Flagellimonas onchidii]|uniref:tagaturonate reductase n=1 Tax=Flagellimonas onchidii TaxID=2562684 RepID=UPI0010A60F26|nr:tagaturonate reductase [Allomuricauda onchidii]
MNPLNRKTVSASTYTEKIVQFGEGNFLRAFVDWMVHEMNKKADFDAGVVVVQPIEKGLVKILNDQDGLYTLYLNGIKNGEPISEHQIIDCIQRGINPYENYQGYLDLAKSPDVRFVVSNTTEAGIAYNSEDKLSDVPALGFPAKLTALLHKRFEVFEGATDKGLIILPCELIDQNGINLKKIVLQYAEDWGLGEEFMTWVNANNIFCNTLVDRIVSGYPGDKIDSITAELGYKDNLVVEGEQFHLWVIQGPGSVKEELPLQSCGLNVVFTDDIEAYRTRKVRILNGAHTSLVSVGYLYGIDKVRESLEDEVVGAFLKEVIFDEICPTLDFPPQELEQFAQDILDRFRNPYLEHELMSISLNSVPKFKARVLPSILEYVKRKKALPKRLLFSLASLIVFYRGERKNEPIKLRDDQKVLDFFTKKWSQVAMGNPRQIKELTCEVLSQQYFWGMDLTSINGVQEFVSEYVQEIVINGMKNTLIKFETE